MGSSGGTTLREQTKSVKRYHFLLVETPRMGLANARAFQPKTRTPQPPPPPCPRARASDMPGECTPSISGYRKHRPCGRGLTAVLHSRLTQRGLALPSAVARAADGSVAPPRAPVSLAQGCGPRLAVVRQSQDEPSQRRPSQKAPGTIPRFLARH